MINMFCTLKAFFADCLRRLDGHDAVIRVFDAGNVIEIVAGFVGTEYESEGEWRWNRLHF